MSEDDRDYGPGWWSSEPLGATEDDEDEQMSTASRTALGGDPLGISGKGVVTPDEAGLGAVEREADEGPQRERRTHTRRGVAGNAASARRSREEARHGLGGGRPDLEPVDAAEADIDAGAPSGIGSNPLGPTGSAHPELRGGMPDDHTGPRGDAPGPGHVVDPDEAAGARTP